MAIKLDMELTYDEGIPPINSNDSLIMCSYEIMWQTKIIITPLLVAMAPKLGKMGAHLDGLLPIKSHDHDISQDHVTN